MIAASELRDIVQLKASDTTEDTYLERLEGYAVDLVENATGRYFGASKTFTEFFDGEDVRALYLQEAASAITSVHRRSYPGDTWEEVTEAEESGWELQGRKLLRKGGSVWARGWEYRVIYDFGYAAGAEPGEIRQAVGTLVAYWYEKRMPVGTPGLNAQSNLMPFHLQSILARWRRHTV